MFLIFYRGNNTNNKKQILDVLIEQFKCKYIDSQNGQEDENIKKVRNFLLQGQIVLVDGLFFKEEEMISFKDKLEVELCASYLLVRTDEYKISQTFDFFDGEIVINKNMDLIETSNGIKRIINAVHKTRRFISEIKKFPKENILKLNPEYSETTTWLLNELPINNIIAMIREILKRYYIDNDKKYALEYLYDFMKFIPLIRYNIRTGAKCYRVCNYKEDGNYKNLDEIWYPKATTKDVRIKSPEQQILFVGEHWGSSFIEVLDRKKSKRPFIALELEVIKRFGVNFNAPLHLVSHKGTSTNRMYQDYIKDCRKEKSIALQLKQDMIRNFIGDFFIANEYSDREFTYDFTKQMSISLLDKFKDEGIGYLSTKNNYQFNNFALPGKIADECLQPKGVTLYDYEFDPNGNMKPWIEFKKIKSGYVDLKTKDIIF